MTYRADISISPAANAETLSNATSWLGDWLLTFAGESGRFPARSAGATWRLAQGAGSWQLWLSSPGEGWNGSPLEIVETPEWIAWLVGELYGPSTTAASIMDLLAKHRTPSTLNGHFVLLAHHKQSDEWHVWTNRLATFHAYWATGGTKTAVGTFAPAVAAATGQAGLDWDGLTSFFGFGFFGGDRTHRQGVHIMRPATHYCFDARGRLASETRYWHWVHEPDAARAYDATIDEFADLFQTIMDELTAAGRIALPISGGLDSRSTVATMGPDNPARARLWAYSYGYGQSSVETRIARQVATAHDLPFQALTIGPYLFPHLPKIVASVEGFQDVTQARQAAVADEIAVHADYLIAAHWGDVFLDDMGVEPERQPAGGLAALAALAAKKFHKDGSDWLLEHLSRPRLSVPPQQFLNDMVASELDRAGAAADPDFRIKMLKTEQWSARWTTASLRMFQAAAFPRLPFYDTRMVDFFCTVPTEFVRGRQMQIDYLKRYAPELARVPWQVTGRDLFANRHDTAADVARRAVRKGWRVLRRQQVIERNWEIQFSGAAGRAGLAHWLLRPGLAVHEFVAPAAIKALLDAFERDPNTEKRGYTVSMLLTFSAWLELQAGGASR